jgi:hypothetical protein
VPLGRILIISGVLLVVLGVLLTYSGSLSFLKLGRLPGDIWIRRGNFSLYVPFTTCILLSLLLTLVLYWLRK